MDIIAKLNRLRLERNMSVYRLAELSGLNQSTLANTFSRGTIPSIRNLEIICNRLGITLSQFFCEDEKEVSMTAADREFFGNYKKTFSADAGSRQKHRRYHELRAEILTHDFAAKHLSTLPCPLLFDNLSSLPLRYRPLLIPSVSLRSTPPLTIRGGMGGGCFAPPPPSRHKRLAPCAPPPGRHGSAPLCRGKASAIAPHHGSLVQRELARKA